MARVNESIFKCLYLVIAVVVWKTVDSLITGILSKDYGFLRATHVRILLLIGNVFSLKIGLVVPNDMLKRDGRDFMIFFSLLI